MLNNRRMNSGDYFYIWQSPDWPNWRYDLAVLAKARFWQRVPGASLNERQVKVLNRLLDGFEGKLTSGKWAALAKCSTDTALRDITGLVELGGLQRSSASGRSTSYELTAA